MSIEKDLMYNASGYIDPTAYYAIEGVAMINWKDGDVFEFAKKDGGTIQKVVLKAFKKYAAVIALYPNEQYEYEHEVYSDQLMHACVAKIGTVPARDFEDADYVCNIGPVAYDKLVDHVAIALGLYAKQLGVTIPVQPEPEMQTSSAVIGQQPDNNAIGRDGRSEVDMLTHMLDQYRKHTDWLEDRMKFMKEMNPLE